MKKSPRALSAPLVLVAVLALLPCRALAVVHIDPFIALVEGNGRTSSLDFSTLFRAQVGGAGVTAAQDTVVTIPGDNLTVVSTGSCRSNDPQVTAISLLSMRFTTDKPLPISLSGSIIGDATCDFRLQGDTVDFHPVLIPGVSVPLSFNALLPPGEYQFSAVLSSVPGQVDSWNFRINAGASPEIHWIKRSGGRFDDKNAWDPAQIPGAANTAVFDLANHYEVSVGNQHTGRMIVKNGKVTVFSPTFLDINVVDGSSSGEPSTVVTNNGTLVLDRGELDSADAVIAPDLGVTGRVDILGDGLWRTSGRLTLGFGGMGEMKITGGAVFSQEGRVGTESELTVESLALNRFDSGAAWNITGDLSLGESDVTVKNGGLIAATNVRMGEGDGGCRVTIFDLQPIHSNPPSSQLAAINLQIGIDQDCASALFILKGGSVVVGNDVELGVGCLGNIVMSNFGGRLVNVPATLRIAHDLRLGTTADGEGRLNMFLGSSVSCANDVVVGAVGKGFIEINAGTFNVTTGQTTIGGPRGSGSLTVVNGAKMDVQALDIGARGSDFADVQIGGSGSPARLLATTIQIGGSTPSLLGSTMTVAHNGIVGATVGIVVFDGNGTLNNARGTVLGPVIHLPALAGRQAARGPEVRMAVNASASGLTRGEAPALATFTPNSTAPTIRTPKLTNNGMIALGAAEGFVIDGDFEQGATGTFVSEIAGSKPGKDYGQLTVTGKTMLDGKVVLQFMNGFAPKPGQKFDFVTAPGAPTGDFTSIAVQGLAPGAQFQVTLTNGIHTATSTNLATALPTVSLRAATPKLTEKKPKAGGFVVSRTGKTTAPLTVNYSIAGSATNGSDYPTLSGSVTIPVKKKTATIVVTAIDDDVREQPETVELAILPTAEYTHSKRSKAKLTIIDND